MLGKHRRRLANIQPILGQTLVFSDCSVWAQNVITVLRNVGPAVWFSNPEALCDLLRLTIVKSFSWPILARIYVGYTKLA